eukprot:g141.t1
MPFKIDVQTLTYAVLMLVPAGVLYGMSDKPKSEDELKRELEKKSRVSMAQAKRGNDALQSLFKNRSKNGKFDQEMEDKLDALLRGGVQTKRRKNTDNEAFHNKGKESSK